MTNEELVALIQAGERDRLPELWEQVERFVAWKASKLLTVMGDRIYSYGVEFIEVINPVHYASYVEFGHRTPSGKGWVPGQYFLTLSEQELRALAPGIIEKKLERLLREVFNV